MQSAADLGESSCDKDYHVYSAPSDGMYDLLLTQSFTLGKEFIYENKLGQILAASWDITVDCLSLLQNMTSKNSVNTGDEDYWLVQSRSNGLTFRKRMKKETHSHRAMEVS